MVSEFHILDIRIEDYFFLRMARTAEIVVMTPNYRLSITVAIVNIEILKNPTTTRTAEIVGNCRDKLISNNIESILYVRYRCRCHVLLLLVLVLFLLLHPLIFLLLLLLLRPLLLVLL